jgi:glycosyltransferase involved in cell wall biosynthesis
MSHQQKQKPKKLLLLIRSLHIGGAERQVVSLAKSMSELGTEVQVAVKVSGGPLEQDLESLTNVKLHNLGSPGLLGKFKYFLRLRSLIKSNQFDAVYGFMPVPNLALLVARTIRNRPLIAWGVRSSDVDHSQYGGLVKWTMRFEKWLSRFADRIITNSMAALEEYRLTDYPYAKLSHIPNAIDVERFSPDPDARADIENELALPAGVPLIGVFARIHPMKDHLTFLRAAKLLLHGHPEARFICAGDVSTGFAAYNERVRTNATDLGLDENVIWLGPRTDPQVLMAACDITTLTSDSGEGFPNSVAESMACGTPCVAVDVGDAAEIVEGSGTGHIVPRKDAEAIANAWDTQLKQLVTERESIAEQARQSIIDRYSPTSIAQETLELLSR